MTPAKSGPTNVVVVDGSNIATEGRSMPSLSQLNDAVMAFTEEFPDAVITVVVDATFGHRIDKKELAEFDAAVAHNEVVAPPAGAIGRGDAFVLSIANKVGARILSNDSFQEFHGDYPWLFDEGRLIGGKPVPFVGWVFVERLPVKGPVSRKATRATRGGGSGSREARPSRRTASREASLPMPVPTTPPPAARRSQRERAPQPAAAASASVDAGAELAAPRPPRNDGSGEQVNDLLPFLEFVEHHPMGSSVNGVVESYSSHGAYVTVDDVRGYVPLRLMGDPPPRSAREMMKLGDAVTLVVTSFAPARRSIDLAIPSVAPITEVVATPMLEELAEAVAPARSTSRRGKKAAAPAPEPAPAATEAPRPRRGRAKAAAEPVDAPADVDATPVVAVASDPPAPAAAPAKRTPAKRTPAKKAAAKKAAAEQPAASEPPTVPDAPLPAATKAPARRGGAKAAAAPAAPPAPRSRGRKAAAPAAEPATASEAAGPDATAPASEKPARKRAAKKAAAPAPDVASEQQPAPSPTPAKRAPRKRSAAVPPEAS